MSNQTSEFATPRINTRALLGLYDPEDSTDWGPIRAAQLNAGAQLALFLLGVNVVSAALVTLLCRPLAPGWLLAGWAGLLTVVSTVVALRRLAPRHRKATIASVRDVRDTMLDGISLAAVWSVIPFAIGPQATIGAALGLWIVISLLMTALAVALAGLPLATLSFLGFLGGAVTAMLAIVGGPLLAIGAALFTILLMLGCFTRGRALVVIRASEIALAERDETVRLLLRDFEDQGADWLWEIDAARRVVRASPRFCHAVGLDPIKINGMSFLQILAGPTWEQGNFSAGLRSLSDKLKQREAFRDLLLPVEVRGEQRWWEMTASPRIDEEGRFCGFRGVGSDVTEQRASADRINRMARFDTLTGLPNRLHINETLAKAMAEAEKWGARCAFMMIDLDRFKAVNDTLGHPVGDRLLRRVSERLGQLMSANETCGRLGGDEFAVVVRDAGDTDRIEKLALAIIDTLSRPYDIDQNTLYIGASVGVAIGPRDGRTAEMLIRSADLALYRTKDGGGAGFHIYEPQLHLQAEERRQLEMALRSALPNGELHLQYQPVVEATTGSLAGFEALLRWTHPELGTVPPDKFVPLAEEARLIAPIGEWVLRTACEEAAAWPSDVRVAVNVSAEQLHNPQFAAMVAQALAQSALAPERLELEVTESVFLHEGTCATAVLERLLDLGVRLSLDDFGTGYSSLAYLSRTRFSTIKIDRTFVQGASRGKKEAIAIIRAVVALAQSLGMATTAEGVETAEEHEMIQGLGCTKVQGYYFGRPLPVEEARAIACRPFDDSANAAA
ncbi:MAG TPA: EAL domain-containing protein [Sphingomonas sp.]|nr:EAL domain-containing protein [Sphingomonas sp.]